MKKAGAPGPGYRDADPGPGAQKKLGEGRGGGRRAGARSGVRRGQPLQPQGGVIPHSAQEITGSPEFMVTP